MDESAQVTQLCLRLGAPPEQARVMAEQILKRVDQLAAERGFSRMDAMDYLLRLVTQGRTGEPPREFPGAPPPAGPQNRTDSPSK